MAWRRVVVRWAQDYIDDDIRLETDQLAREACMTFLLSLSPLVPDDEILSLHVAELTEALTKGVD
jgi:hypothetical protein